MRTTELYRQRTQRRRKAGNYEAVTEAFWALCREEGSHTERDVQESYLLARLLPHARSQGSRRIVADAYLAPRTKTARQEREVTVKELDQLLQGCHTATTTPLSFSRQTAEVLGPPILAEEVKEIYQARCARLFDPAVTTLATDKEAGVARLLAGWRRLMQSVGRHRGRPVEKQVLDILSYEARVALDRCYSAVWGMLLLPRLTQAYEFTPETVSFLRLWHLDQASESNLGELALFHLFHAHALALHPATALFLSTPTGRELVGRWLVTGGSKRAFHRLLHGMLIAVHHYANVREDVAQRRRKQPLGFGGSELNELEERLAKKRRRRRAQDG